MRRYRLAAFDIDGTLIDTEKTGVLSLVKTIRELKGQDVAYEDARFYFGIPSAKVAGMLEYGDEEEFGRRWEENFIELSGYIAPFPGVVRMLEAVRAAGYITAMVTSRSRFEFSYDKFLPSMTPSIDVVICAEDSVRHKPDPDPMLACIAKASELSGSAIEPKDCLYLGDTEHDCRCAHSAGCNFALADWRGRGLQGIPAEYIFRDAEEVLGILGCTQDIR